MKRKSLHRIAVGLGFVMLISTGAFAQPAEIPAHTESYVMHSGFHFSAPAGIGADFRIGMPVFSGTVKVPGAQWLRLYFSDVNLGAGSYILITREGLVQFDAKNYQRLDTEAMAEWQNTSAYFNGSVLTIDLYVAKDDQNIFFALSEVVVGDAVGTGGVGKRGGGGGVRLQTICGTTDDRGSATNDAVGRLIFTEEVPWGCTGWLLASGAVLTAGHCTTGENTSFDVLQFHVESSLANGELQHPANQHQYPVQSIIDVRDGGRGNDWAVLTYASNPLLDQQAFHRISRDINLASIGSVSITGYGVDGPTPDFGTDRFNRNADNQTLQGHSGPFVRVVQSHLQYRVDTQGANSGSPVLTSGVSIGIHTHGGCEDPNRAFRNSGTSFGNDALEAAIESTYPLNVVWVDNGHPDTFNEGTLFRPAATVGGGIAQVPSGGTLRIISGAYPEAISTSKSMTLSAAFGVVRLGPSPGSVARLPSVASADLNGSVDPSASARLGSEQPPLLNSIEEGVPKEFGLEQNYPNPFNPTTTLRYSLKEDVHVNVTIYNVLGQEIVTLIDNDQRAGVKSVVWNGHNTMGQAVPSGVYLYRLIAGEFRQAKTMLLLK